MEQKQDIVDWKGSAGDKFANWNAPNWEGRDKEWFSIYGKTASEVMTRAVGAMKDTGFVVDTANVLDIGCSTGGMLSVLEKIGFKPDNLQGVDHSPAAIEINKREHPNYKVELVNGFEYGNRSADLVYHCGVLCQITEEDYSAFFAKISAMKPKYYMFIEAINPRGYEKIANSLIHAVHDPRSHEGHGGHGGHDGHQADGHSHGHAHGGHVEGGHGGGHAGHGGHGRGHGEHGAHGHHIGDLLQEGYHHTNNMEKVVEKYFPEAKKVFSEKLQFGEEFKPRFEVQHVEYCLCNVYAI